MMEKPKQLKLRKRLKSIVKKEVIKLSSMGSSLNRFARKLIDCQFDEELIFECNK